MGCHNGPKITKTNLVQQLDSVNTKSYSGSGNSWTDLLTKTNATITGATYNSGSFTFNGTSDYISLGNLGSFYTQGTIGFWMKSTAVENYRNAFATKYNGGNGCLRMEQTTAGDFYLLAGNDAGISATYSFVSGTTLSANQWYRVTIAWNTSASTLKGYLNGVQKFSTTTHTYWPTTIPSLTLGLGFDTTRYFKGNITQVSVYNSMLSDSEIRQNFLAFKGRYGV